MFDSISHKTDEGVEYWLARELQPLLGYVEWRKFEGAITRAKEACKNSGFCIDDHFVGAAKTIEMPKTATKEVNDYMLTRYACYLVAQNCDPRKEGIIPEELPASEDMKKLERKVKKLEKNLENESGKLKK